MSSKLVGQGQHKFYAATLIFLAVFLVGMGCSNENDPTPAIEPIVDQGPSIYADADVTNDVMLQSFWWDTYTDPKILQQGSFYQFLSENLIEISNANIDVLWLPPPSEGEGMGYHPRQLFDFNSNHGTEAELKSLLTAIKNRKMHGMADLVFNHRIGTDTWTDFTNPSWSCDAICIDDEGYTNPNAFGTKPCGAIDEGLKWDGARDLNHQSLEVRNGLKDYLTKLKNLGFDSWRYDFVKGFPAKYIGEYNSATAYYYSLGEYWDGDALAIKNWIDGTESTVTGATVKKSGAFDFDLKYKLKAAIVDHNYSVLRSATDGTVGLSGINGYNDKSVTFLDNHDSGCINRTDCDNLFSKSISQIRLGYLYILTHPGIPMVWAYHYFFSDPSGGLKKDINDFILLRKQLGIHANSTVKVLATVDGAQGYYAAEIDGKILVKIGPGTYTPGNEWKLRASESDYSIWTL
ncbi:MAG: alpha-amylase family glycosyl hydrolase [Maribacter sp.]|nr:alpha-amylase family glycosyl hydrolase [Maribacter sp.]